MAQKEEVFYLYPQRQHNYNKMGWIHKKRIKFAKNRHRKKASGFQRNIQDWSMCILLVQEKKHTRLKRKLQ